MRGTIKPTEACLKSWIEVSAERLTGNYRAAAAVNGTALLAVVKANAYGHGAIMCAPILARAGAEWLGVTDAEEGGLVRSTLRAEGVDAEVLVMCGSLPEEAEAIVAHGLTPVVWERGQLESLAQAAGDTPVSVHLEIDSGMTRQGVAVEGLGALLQELRTQPRLRLNGVMTHFASAEVAWSPQTAAQRERFAAAIGMIAEAGLRVAWVHAGNTSAIDNKADGVFAGWLREQAARLGGQPMARAGLGLYGYCLPVENLSASDGEGTPALRSRVLPVMTWKTRVIGVSEVEAGAAVGYNGTFVADRPMRLALLPVGYADGLRRELSGPTAGRGGWVMVRGRRGAIVGLVSMNLTTVDVTGIEGVSEGDEVVLLGEGVTAEDHAALARTIAYEILCGVRGPVVLA